MNVFSAFWLSKVSPSILGSDAIKLANKLQMRQCSIDR
jgi:hypothetical protein